MRRRMNILEEGKIHDAQMDQKEVRNQYDPQAALHMAYTKVRSPKTSHSLALLVCFIAFKVMNGLGSICKCFRLSDLFGSAISSFVQ
jgi:multidrug efflux pump subunit AcrB